MYGFDDYILVVGNFFEGFGELLPVDFALSYA